MDAREEFHRALLERQHRTDQFIGIVCAILLATLLALLGAGVL